ncbi:MAG TPA: M48 family metalloprotease [Candidatus Sulfotelmatobacter sp.]|nr:M48 family metalloprotease [Candidatus Sulfotelmatobacter sp.]
MKKRNTPTPFLAAAVLVLLAAASAQDSQAPASATKPAPPPAAKTITLGELVDSIARQERHMTDLMRNFRPIVETYIQEEKPDPALMTSPKDDDYFLSRLDLSGKTTSALAFTGDEHGKNSDTKLPKDAEAFAAGGFAQALFPDMDHFDRQNYNFEFVRWENLGDVRCGVLNVSPREGVENRGFFGRIWVEDQNYSIVRFTGSYSSKAFAKRSFHFDSWRENLISIVWLPAYVYTEESDPKDPTRHGLWFKAQTRIWGYDLANAGDHKEYAKRLTDTPGNVDPKRNEASQSLSADYTLGKSTYTADDNVVERLQVAGLMAPDGEVNKVLETVVNNILVTNDLDIPAVRVRVLLTTPLESFVMGRTIVLSRGLVDVLPDEATLAAVLSHELAHIVLQHSTGETFMAGLTLPFSDLEVFSHLNFHFDSAQEADADKKGLELFAKSPYKDKLASAALFIEALDARSPELPNLLHGRLSNDFGSSHLAGMKDWPGFPKQLKMDQVDQVAALPLGSRVVLDAWSDKITLLRGQAPRPQSASEKMPFEVTPFLLHLKRLEEPAKTPSSTSQPQ